MSKTQLAILEKLNNNLIAVFNSYKEKWILMNGKIEMHVHQKSMNILYKKGLIKEDGAYSQGLYKYIISDLAKKHLKEYKR